MKFYRCAKCGKIIGIIQDSACPTMCCGQAMDELTANTTDGAHEKHVPVITIDGSKVTVEVGSVAHPMLEAHYIQWIALETKQGMQRKPLKPDTEPKAVFALAEGDEVVCAYEYCNLHGLWKAEA
ncbi:MAG: desulfoferrodoxin [Eubacterium sp.]|nr:desulfoferrodoxin [Eubacterium sp.]